MSACSARVTDAAVGGGPDAITTWTMLFLLRKVTFAPAPLCVQPSGYLIEYAGVGVEQEDLVVGDVAGGRRARLGRERAGGGGRADGRAAEDWRSRRLC